VALSQFLIVWSGNLPEELPWYLTRLHGGWEWVGLALVVFHFVFPFVVLLSRDLKRNATTLGTLALGLLAMRLLDLFWLVGPDLQGHHGGHGGGFSIHILDFAVPAAMGGLWTLGFLHELKRRPLLPLGMQLDIVIFQPDLVQESVNDATVNLSQTMAVVLVVVMMFLGWRTGLIVGAMVPLTVMLTLLGMTHWGFSDRL